jgi:hypothetical protein
MTMKIHAKLQEKGNKGAEDAVSFVLRTPTKSSELLDAMYSRSKRVKNAAAKAVRIISEDMPELLLPYFDKFAELMRGDDTILKWISIDVIGNLSGIDSHDKVNQTILRHLCLMLSDESMVTASHAIDSLGKIAAGKEKFRSQITKELLRVETIERNAECRDILLGRTILSYSSYVNTISEKEKEAVIALANRQLNNRRVATRKKVEEFLKRVI